MIRTAMLTLAFATPLFAQTMPDPVALGDRIRVHAPESGYEKLVGRVTATTPDAISMKVDGAAGEFHVRREQILFMYKSAGRKRNTMRGLALGAPIGLGLAIWFGPKSGSPTGGNTAYKTNVPRNAAAGAIAGALLGAGIGFTVRTDTWVPARRD
jgi:hypothetical protein